MKCNMDCLNCIHPDCIRSLTADNQVYVKRWQEKNPDKVRQYQKIKRENFSPEKKQAELQRLTEWKRNNPSKVKRSLNRCGKRWRKAHREQERERNRLNYQKKKAERVS